MPNTETLRELAAKHLSPSAQTSVEISIQDGELKLASVCILGAIDYLWSTRQISDREAREDIEKLEIDPEERARLRSDCMHINRLQ